MVYLITTRKSDAENTKQKITEFIKNELGIELDQDKTKIMHLQKGINFLGYELRMYNQNQNKIKNMKQNVKRNSLMRTTSQRLSILPSKKVYVQT
jgi:RNA-directed DNA polymerase